MRACFHRVFDLQSIPRRSFFATFARFAANPTEAERLRELADPQNLDDYLDYCQRPRRTTAEALRDFPASSAALFSVVDTKEAVKRAFALFPAIRPRAFSIASAPTAHPNVIQVLVAKVSANLAIMTFRNCFSQLVAAKKK